MANIGICALNVAHAWGDGLAAGIFAGATGMAGSCVAESFVNIKSFLLEAL